MVITFVQRAMAFTEQVRRQTFIVTLRRQESGSALVEFAVSAILLFTLIFGVLQCSRALYTYHFLGSAAQEAARYAMVRGASWTSNCSSAASYSCVATSSNVATFVQGIASAGISKSGLGVSTTWPGQNAAGASCLQSSSTPTNTAGCVVTVTVTYSFSFGSSLLPSKALALTSTAKETIVQ